MAVSGAKTSFNAGWDTPGGTKPAKNRDVPLLDFSRLRGFLDGRYLRQLMNMKSMRLYATLILSAIIAAPVCLAAQGNPPPPLAPPPPAALTLPASGPIIEFDNTTYDFGRAAMGEKIQHTFAVTNTGNQTLQITNVHPGCHCTTVGDWTHLVEPGKTGGITLQFDTSGLNGTVQRTIDVFSNAKNQPRETLYLKGTVWKPFDVFPTVAVLSIPPDFTNEMTTTVRIVNQTGNPVTISNPVSANRLFSAVLKEIRPGTEYQLAVTALPPFPAGNSPGTITLNTSLPANPTINVPVSASVIPPIQVYPSQIIVSSLPDHWTTNRVTIHGNTTNLLALSNPKADDSRIHVEIQPTSSKGMFTLLVSFPPGFHLAAGKKAEITVESNHPRLPLVKIPVTEYPHPKPMSALRGHPNPTPAAAALFNTGGASPAHPNPPPAPGQP